MRRILLDNCLDRRLVNEFEGYEVLHVLDRNWDRLGDVNLVKFAAEEFDVLITVDRNMPHQVNLKGLKLAVVVLRAPTNRLKDCLPRIPDLLAALPDAVPGEFLIV